MNTDEKIKEQLINDVNECNQRERRWGDVQPASVREEWTVKPEGICLTTRETYAESNRLFVETFCDLRENKIQAVYGLTEEGRLVKVIYNPSIGFMVLIDKQVKDHFTDVEEVANKFWSVVDKEDATKWRKLRRLKPATNIMEEIEAIENKELLISNAKRD